MDDLPQNATRERIMDTAEALFMARGYSAVKLRDIANAVGMRHASLYYYVPKGKKQLFVAMLRRSMARHELAMTRLIAQAGDDIRAQAYAVSDWLVSQPPVDMVRMFESDLRQFDGEESTEIANLIINSLTEPLITALNRANAEGSVQLADTGMAAMALLTLIQGVHHIPLESLTEGRKAFGRQMTDMLLTGWLTR